MPSEQPVLPLPKVRRSAAAKAGPHRRTRTGCPSTTDTTRGNTHEQNLGTNELHRRQHAPVDAHRGDRARRTTRCRIRLHRPTPRRRHERRHRRRGDRRAGLRGRPGFDGLLRVAPPLPRRGRNPFQDGMYYLYPKGAPSERRLCWTTCTIAAQNSSSQSLQSRFSPGSTPSPGA